MPDSREKTSVRDPVRVLRLVVERKPILFYPRPKQDPNYHILYWRETLECGHKQEHGWPDPAVARRRECKKCAKERMAVQMRSATRRIPQPKMD